MYRKALFEAVEFHNSDEVCSILGENEFLPADMLNECLLHFVKEVGNDKSDSAMDNSISFLKKFDIIYMLLDSGADIDNTDKNGNSSLYYAAVKENHELCDVLLQCGADMWLTTEHGVSIYEYVSHSDISPDLMNVFDKYHPGLWQAVESENIYQVRQLINYWCRTNLQKNGVSLKDIALESGNEEIINQILGVCESMDLVYHILARNTKAVKTKLETSKKKLRLNLRKMSDHGAPILYYLIQSRNVPMIELFIKHDCQIYTIMQDDVGNDLPVLFSSLKPDMSVSVMEALLPKDKVLLEEILYKILYKGKTVLEIAMEKGVNKDIFQLLIDRGGPLLLCDRNQFNETVQDIAVSLDQHLYASAIDECVCNWIANPTRYPGRREKLSLFGWRFKWSLCEKDEFIEEDILQFIEESNFIQAQIIDLSVAIERGNVSKFMDLKTNKYSSNPYWADLLWHGRVVGDGIPLLHRAVLHNRPEIVEIILDEKPLKESIDNLFDQHHRTALHYAFSRSLGKRIQKLLLMSGCSEHVLDKNSKEPLDFRDKQDSPILMKLLNRLKVKNFSECEPDVWNSKSVEYNLLDDNIHFNEENLGDIQSMCSNEYHCHHLTSDENSIKCGTDDTASESIDNDVELSSEDGEEEESRSQCIIL